MERAYPPGMDSPYAKSWLQWPAQVRQGTQRIPETAQAGDIAVGERLQVGGKLGHVAILVAYELDPTDPAKDRLLLLGGNQGRNPLNSTMDKGVRYTWYPRETSAPRPYGKFLQLRYQP